MSDDTGHAKSQKIVTVRSVSVMTPDEHKHLAHELGKIEGFTFYIEVNVMTPVSKIG